MDFFEILVDKAFDIVIGFLLGILIISLHRRADRFVHAQIENLHDYVTGEQHKLLSEIHKMHDERTMTREKESDRTKDKE